MYQFFAGNANCPTLGARFGASFRQNAFPERLFVPSDAAAPV